MIKACVIGWPIEHSRSPLIHGYWLRQYGIAGSYEKIAVAPDELGAFIRDLRENGYAGCNVTVPHKETVREYIDYIDPVATAIGAVNTIWLDNGQICGTNTDIIGAMAYLDAQAPGWRTRCHHIAVVGAGGAARGVVYGLLQATGDARVAVANRTPERAEALIADLAQLSPGRSMAAVSLPDLADQLETVDLLINTSTAGMAGVAPLDLPLTALPKTAIVYDIVYKPLETPLLAAARAQGLHAIDGLGMLLHQAVPGFERWFGVRPEVTAELWSLIAADIEKTA